LTIFDNAGYISILILQYRYYQWLLFVIFAVGNLSMVNI